MSKSFKLAALSVQGYKRITLAEATFDQSGGVVAVMGDNEQGKSSYLDALEALIAGRAAPKNKQPVNVGSDEARIIGTFVGDDGVTIVATRTYTPDGKTSIVVKQDGLKVAKADDLLRRFYSYIAIDPHGFARLSSKEQVDTLVRLTGFDPAPIDTERANVYATRTAAGQEVKRLKGAVESYGPQQTPGELIDVAAVAAELDAVHALQRTAAELDQSVDIALREHGDAAGDVERAKEALAQAEANLANWSTTLAQRELAAATASRPDGHDLREKIRTAEAQNETVRHEQARERTRLELAAAEGTQQGLTDRIAALDQQKKDGFAGVEMPVEGLTIEDGEVYLNGTPFSQTSPGGKLRTSTQIAMALQPELRALVIRDGSLLDDANRKVIADIAAEKDYLVLMEIVGQGAENGILFEDGRIVPAKEA